MVVRSLSKAFRELLTDILAKRYNKLLTSFFPRVDNFRNLLDTTGTVLGSYPLLYLVDFTISNPPKTIFLFANAESSQKVISFIEDAGYERTDEVASRNRLVIGTTQFTFTKDAQTVKLRTSDCNYVIFKPSLFSRSVNFIVASGSGFVIAYPRDFYEVVHHSLGYTGAFTRPFQFVYRYHMRHFGDAFCMQVPFATSFHDVVPRYKDFTPVWHDHYRGGPMRGFGLDNTLNPYTFEKANEQRLIFASTRYDYE